MRPADDSALHHVATRIDALSNGMQRITAALKRFCESLFNLLGVLTTIFLILAFTCYHLYHLFG